MIHIRELTGEDAPAIARIESKYHAPALADGADSHRSFLADAYAEGVNLSFGVFDDGRLVGYLLCYGFERSAFPDQQGEALYIEDIAVLPEYRSMLFKLLRRLGSEAQKHFPGAGIEAHAVQSVFQVWHKHAAIFARHGFPIARYLDTGEVLGGEPRYIVRWEPAADASRSAAGLDQLLAKLPGHPVELAGVQYVVKVLRDESQWPALQVTWDRLLLATPDHTVFQTYAYQRLWWRHFGSDNELFVAIILRDGAVQGIAPLQIQTVQYHGRYCRLLGFIGSRWEVDRPAFLFAEHGDPLLRVLVSFLAHNSDRWDICHLYEQPTHSTGLGVMEEGFRAAGYLVGRARDSDCPYLAITGTWQQFLAGKSQTFRKNLKAAGRKLREAGALEYRVYDAAPDVLEQLEVYRGIEARSWKSAEGVGVSRDEDYFAFYGELAEVFAKERAFIIRMLTVDGKAIAGTFGLAYDGVFHSLQIAHDREFSRCSPGTYLEGLEMEQCFGQGYREYEFLGGFLNNKSRWTSTFRYTSQLHVFRRTWFFTALHILLFRMKPWVKDRLRPYMKSWRQSSP